jgi:hypothetical protein
MLRKVTLLLRLGEGKSLNLLEGYLASLGQTVRERVPRGYRHRRAVLLPGDPLRGTAHGAAMKAAEPPFEAVFEVGGEAAPETVLLEAVEGAASVLGEWIDASRSAAILGEERVIVPGRHPVLLVFALRRRRELGAEEFHAYWRDTHAEVGEAVPGLPGYRQLHGEAAANRAAAAAAGVAMADFDGAAEGYYPDLAAFAAVMGQPEVAVDALEDEKRFIDHARSVIGVYRIAWETGT